VALASARRFSRPVTLPTRPPLSTIWRRRPDSNPFAPLRASLVRERRLELPRRRAAVFKTAVAAGSTTRAHCGVPTGIRTRTLAHGALNAACMPVPASARTFSQAQSYRTAPNWSARRDSNPQGLRPLRSKRSAYACSATRGNLEDGRRIELRVNRFAGGAVSVSLPSSNWWVEQDSNLQARQEQPGYGRLVSPITTSTQNLVGRGRFELPRRSSAF
jgi:hypothetical protein